MAKHENVTAYICDRCGEMYVNTSSAYAMLPKGWRIDSSNNKMLCEGCNILYECLKQAFYNPKAYNIVKTDWGMSILETTMGEQKTRR